MQPKFDCKPIEPGLLIGSIEFPLNYFKVEEGGWFSYGTVKVIGTNGEKFKESRYYCGNPRFIINENLIEVIAKINRTVIIVSSDSD